MGNQSDKVSIPVVIDSIKSMQGFNMARCMYFSIACTTPAPGWELELSTGDVPFLMLGLSGVITGPVGAKRFTRVEDIERLFNLIEGNEHLFIDINDVWIPGTLFLREVTRSHVYRIPLELFRIAYDYTCGRIPMEDEYEKMAHEALHSAMADTKHEYWRLQSEEQESEIFQQWQHKTIQERREMKFHEEFRSFALGRKYKEGYHG